MSRRRVVVTGIGMISPLGVSTLDSWDSLLAGRASVAPVPTAWQRYAKTTSTVWAPLPELDWPTLGIDRIEQMQLDTSGMLAIAASAEAFRDAGIGTVVVDTKKNTFRIDGPAPDRCGVCMGTAVGGATSFVGNLANHVMSPLGRLLPGAETLPPMPPRFSPYAVPAMMPNAVSSLLGIRWSLQGPNITFAQACAAGTVAVGHAFRTIATRVGPDPARVAEFAERINAARSPVIVYGSDIARSQAWNEGIRFAETLGVAVKAAELKVLQPLVVCQRIKTRHI